MSVATFEVAPHLHTIVPDYLWPPIEAIILLPVCRIVYIEEWTATAYGILPIVIWVVAYVDLNVLQVFSLFSGRFQCIGITILKIVDHDNGVLEVGLA